MPSPSLLSRPAREVELVVLDFETTGVYQGFPSEPWQIGMVAFGNGSVRWEKRFASWLRVGDRPFNPHAPGRHAQVRDQLLAAPPLPILWPQLRAWLTGRALAAHNVATERTVLGQAFPMHAFGPWIDTLTLTRIAMPGRTSHRLEDLVTDLGLQPEIDEACPGLAPHDALYDAVAAARLLEYLLALPGWANLTIADLVHPR